MRPSAPPVLSGSPRARASSVALVDPTLASTSTLIDTGYPTLYDVDGSRSDIGAFGGAGASVYDGDGDG